MLVLLHLHSARMIEGKSAEEIRRDAHHLLAPVQFTHSTVFTEDPEEQVKGVLHAVPPVSSVNSFAFLDMGICCRSFLCASLVPFRSLQVACNCWALQGNLPSA